MQYIWVEFSYEILRIWFGRLFNDTRIGFMHYREPNIGVADMHFPIGEKSLLFKSEHSMIL